MAYNTNPFWERMSGRTNIRSGVRPLLLAEGSRETRLRTAYRAQSTFFAVLLAGEKPLSSAPSPQMFCEHSGIQRRPRASLTACLSSGPYSTSTRVHTLLGALLSCAAGYADLPSGNSDASEGLFRALFNSRVVLRTLRSLVEYVNGSPGDLDNIKLDYAEDAQRLSHIPWLAGLTRELIAWAGSRRRRYSRNWTLSGAGAAGTLESHARFEAVLWLQSFQISVSREVHSSKTSSDDRRYSEASEKSASASYRRAGHVAPANTGMVGRAHHCAGD